MAAELEPGIFGVIFSRLDAEANTRSRFALRPLALALEKQAKINASSGAHKYGTPTPALPGTGPAVISGTLRRNITHSPISKVGGVWETKVGTAVGFYPPYTANFNKRTPSNKYGYFLETGLRNGAKYPFLIPAFDFVIKVPAKLIYDEIYGATWRRVI